MDRWMNGSKEERLLTGETHMEILDSATPKSNAFWPGRVFGAEGGR